MKFKKDKIYLGENETIKSFVSNFRSVKYYAICNDEFITSYDKQIFLDEELHEYKIKYAVKIGYNDFILVVEK